MSVPLVWLLIWRLMGWYVGRSSKVIVKLPCSPHPALGIAVAEVAGNGLLKLEEVDVRAGRELGRGVVVVTERCVLEVERTDELSDCADSGLETDVLELRGLEVCEAP